MGISKRELMEDFYPDEALIVFEEYARLKYGAGGERVKYVTCESFF